VLNDTGQDEQQDGDEAGPREHIIEELLLKAIIGVVSVTAVALLFIPHWSAVIVVTRLICVLYVNLLGAMHWVGIDQQEA
jgi:multidrug efflux pump subunit AcrB